MTPDTSRPPSRREIFERRCYLLGLTDAAEVARQWAAVEAKGGRRGSA